MVGGGISIILSDTHFADEDCKLMDPDWIMPEEQLEIINQTVGKGDTFVCLGDVGDPKYVPMIKARRKILLLGNHDARGMYKDLFQEIYAGPLFISDKILLSHEPVYGLPWCLNIHGHDHNNMEAYYKEDCKHINLAANVCRYKPVNLGRIIKDGILSDIPSIHRMTIDRAIMKKNREKGESLEEYEIDQLNPRPNPYANAQIEIRNLVNDGIRDMQEDNLVDFNETFEELRDRYQNG